MERRISILACYYLQRKKYWMTILKMAVLTTILFICGTSVFFQTTVVTRPKGVTAIFRHEFPNAIYPSDEWKYWSINPRLVRIQGIYGYVQFTMICSNDSNRRTSSLVCLATQTSLNGIHHIIETSNNWRGKMVASIYIPGLEFTRAKILLWLFQQCSLLHSSDVTFYLSWPLNETAIDDASLWQNISSMQCKELPSVSELINVKKAISMYPQNSMRNIARRGCNSEYVIVTDPDMIPTPDLSTALQPVLRQQDSCSKCAFVIPGYELHGKVHDLPTNKKELLQLIQKRLAQPFHWIAFQTNQASHNPTRWERLTNNTSVKVAYPIMHYQYKYEPIYIAKRSAPEFDDRFIGFGFNRNSQIIQMIVEGFRFFLLDNVFLSHRGMKKKNKYSAMRRKESNKNTKVFIDFLKELAAKHRLEQLLNEMEEAPVETVVEPFLERLYNNTMKSN